MKRLIYFIVLMLSFVVVSCNHDGIEYNYEQYVTDTYNAAFVKTFGQPASNQDWGFGNRTITWGKSQTRTAMPNSNEWGTSNGAGYLNFPKPTDITDEERAAVLAVFNEVGKKEYESILDIDSFFVQQVYCGPKGNLMNELATTVDYKREVITESWWPLVQYVTETTVDPYDEIINNFNTGKYSGNAEQGCMLMYNSATLDFSYKTSQSGGQRWYRHWRMEYIPGYGYYVGFDHEAVRQADANENEEDVRDYIYNDWIVKIVPSKGYVESTPNKYKVRIIAEDLSASGGSDFDFNDVVFDVSYVEGVNKTYITLQAAGGTLPLFVAGHEVHAEFGEETGTMINTANGTISKDSVSFEVDGLIAPWDITVAVMKENQLIPLKAETGKPAAKIAVNPDFVWCKEREDIRTIYPNFSQYVQDTTKTDWYK